MKLRALLCVIEQRHLTGGDGPPTYLTTQEGHNETRETQATLYTILNEVLITITLQSANSLIGSTQLHTEGLGASEQITVLIGQRGSGSQVACRIGALWLKTERRGFVGLYLYQRVEKGRVGILLETDVRIAYGSQSSEVIVGVLQVFSRIGPSLFEEGVLTQHVLAQMDDRVLRVTTRIGDVTDQERRVQGISHIIGTIRS